MLLVDDEAQVRKATGRILTRGKHRVTEAASVAEALALAAERRFDVVLLDESLPDGRGSQAAIELKRLLDGASVVLFTGQDVPNEALSGVDNLVHKPLGIGELLDVLPRTSLPSCSTPPGSV